MRHIFVSCGEGDGVGRRKSEAQSRPDRHRSWTNMAKLGTLARLYLHELGAFRRVYREAIYISLWRGMFGIPSRVRAKAFCKSLTSSHTFGSRILRRRVLLCAAEAPMPKVSCSLPEKDPCGCGRHASNYSRWRVVDRYSHYYGLILMRLCKGMQESFLPAVLSSREGTRIPRLQSRGVMASVRSSSWLHEKSSCSDDSMRVHKERLPVVATRTAEEVRKPR